MRVRMLAHLYTYRAAMLKVIHTPTLMHPLYPHRITMNTYILCVTRAAPSETTCEGVGIAHTVSVVSNSQINNYPLRSVTRHWYKSSRYVIFFFVYYGIKDR